MTLKEAILILLGIRDLDAVIVLAIVISLIALDRARRRLSVWTYLFAGCFSLVAWLVLFQFFEPDREHVLNAVASLFILSYLLLRLWGWRPFRMTPSKELELDRKQLELYRKLFGKRFADGVAQARRDLRELEEAERRGTTVGELIALRSKRK